MTAWRICNKCQKNRLTEGGCEISLFKWLCAACWAKYVQRKMK